MKWLLKFIMGGASEFVVPDPAALERAGPEGQAYLAIFRRIVIISAICGALAAATGLAVGWLACYDRHAPKTGNAILTAPFVFAFLGVRCGFAFSCLLAPRAFLESPIAKHWLASTGTSSAKLARGVFFLRAIFYGAPLAVVAVAYSIAWSRSSFVVIP